MTHIGYDAAVCLELFEPWIVDVYNSSVGVVNSIRLLSQTDEVADVLGKEALEGRKLSDESSLARKLNSSHIKYAYVTA